MVKQKDKSRIRVSIFWKSGVRNALLFVYSRILTEYKNFRVNLKCGG